MPEILEHIDGSKHVWVYEDDEYGSLADGGSYEIHRCSVCGREKFVQLPD